MSTQALNPTSPRAVLADAVPGARVRDAALVAGGVALVSLLAQVEIVLPGTPVPISGQTLGVGLVGATLGMRRGALALALYAVVGLFLPVFSGGSQGGEVLFGATGGYIVGFILAAAVIGRFAEMGADRRVLAAFGAFVVGQLVVFVPGVAVLMAVAGLDLQTGIAEGFTPFIVGGLIKAAIAAAVLPSAWHLVKRFERRS